VIPRLYPALILKDFNQDCKTEPHARSGLIARFDPATSWQALRDLVCGRASGLRGRARAGDGSAPAHDPTGLHIHHRESVIRGHRSRQTPAGRTRLRATSNAEDTLPPSSAPERLAPRPLTRKQLHARIPDRLPNSYSPRPCIVTNTRQTAISAQPDRRQRLVGLPVEADISPRRRRPKLRSRSAKHGAIHPPREDRLHAGGRNRLPRRRLQDRSRSSGETSSLCAETAETKENQPEMAHSSQRSVTRVNPARRFQCSIAL
jgi:hypothetical protein